MSAKEKQSSFWRIVTRRTQTDLIRCTGLAGSGVATGWLRPAARFEVLGSGKSALMNQPEPRPASLAAGATLSMSRATPLPRTAHPTIADYVGRFLPLGPRDISASLQSS